MNRFYSEEAHDAAREQRDAAPDIRVLWSKTPRARKPHLCDCCGEEIAPGAKYESRGWIEDGEHKTEKIHLFAYQYPSGCPTRGAKDRAEIEATDWSEA